MDFGIKAALMTGLRTIAELSRGTGRSTWVVDNALSILRTSSPETEVMIIVAGPNELDRFVKGLRPLRYADSTLKDQADRIRVRAVELTNTLESLDSLLLQSSPTPFVLDHFVIELIYEQAISGVSRHLDDLRARGFPRAALGTGPGDPFGVALYAFGEREERLGAIPRHNLRPWRG